MAITKRRAACASCVISDTRRTWSMLTMDAAPARLLIIRCVVSASRWERLKPFRPLPGEPRATRTSGNSCASPCRPDGSRGMAASSQIHSVAGPTSTISGCAVPLCRARALAISSRVCSWASGATLQSRPAWFTWPML
ncbi:hypothetical protein FQZ97_967360 [compost metagenome]